MVHTILHVVELIKEYIDSIGLTVINGELNVVYYEEED